MNKVIIGRPNIESVKEIKELIAVTIEIASKHRVFDTDELDRTIYKQKKYLSNLEHNHFFIVAKINNKIVGWLDLYPNKKKFKAHVAGLIIGILDNYQHQGIGSLMIAKAIEFAKKHKIKKISTEVAANNVASQELLKKFRFTQEGRQEKELFIKGKYIDNLWFGRIL